ncbi:WD40 repeat-like protein [Gigaspora margarita]|uniref:WD40 repeat-like protein n=1 Tax=Gigaspora margarita TaxID=4874 RepID=A0A8H4APU8_GIGMA|nr:WD40 repeat-like protein [Gigaspora margarita]
MIFFIQKYLAMSSQDIESALSKFKVFNREQRKIFLKALVEDCTPHELYTLQQALQIKNYGSFDIVGTLPLELSVKIFEYLNCRGLCACREVCQKWRSITKDPTIWRTKCLEILYYDKGSISASDMKDIPKEGWEKLYIKLYRRDVNWDNGRVQRVRFLKGHRDRITDSKLKGNILVTGSADRTVRIWNVDTGQCEHVFTGNVFSCVDFLPEEKVVAASTYFRSSFLWSMETKELLGEFNGHVTAVRCISLSKSFIASCSFDGSVIVWNWKSGEKIATIPADSIAVRILDTIILSLSSQKIEAFDINDGTCIFTSPFEEGLIGWSYIQNYLSSIENPHDDIYSQMLSSLSVIKGLSHHSSVRVFDFDTHKNRFVRIDGQMPSAVLWLTLFGYNYRSKMIEYPCNDKSMDLDINKEIFRTINVDCRRIVAGCLSGIIVLLEFDEN